jgi:hypothetical protein
MSELRVMDRSGDTTYTWDPSNPNSVAVAQATFDTFKSQGYRAARMESGGTGEFIDEFDPNSGTVIVVPPMRGG